MTGFTMVFENVVKDCGYRAALVFGAIYRRCQMSEGVCYASHSTLAESIGVDRKFIVAYVKPLLENGYLEAINHPYGGTITYKDTGKVNDEPVLNEDRGCPEKGQGLSLNGTGVVPNRDSKRVFKKVLKKALKENINSDEPILSGRPNIYGIWEQSMGALTSPIAEKLDAAVNDFTEAWVIDAIGIASDNGVHNWAYVGAILNNWHAKGKTDRKQKKSDIAFDNAREDEK